MGARHRLRLQAYGATQIEAINDGILTGNDDRLFFRNTLDMITGKKREGGNVVTTLDSAAQRPPTTA